MLHARPDYQPRIQDAAGLIPMDEPVFLLRAQDRSAADVVRYWAVKNHLICDPKILEMARIHADKMDAWPTKKTADVPPDGAPVPELRGTFPVVLYFGTDEDRKDFVQLIQEAKPGLVAKQL